MLTPVPPTPHVAAATAQILFRVYDSDGKGADVSKHDFVGEVRARLRDALRGCTS
jgi:hypothetical protein